jgi:uncharacterized repeat protein (TIGR02543 family)
VGEGYGYSDGSLFVHLNFGWTGISDAWYSPPQLFTGDDDDFNYNAINGFVFNILPSLPSSTVICSGRVLDADGNPVAGAVVSYCPASGTSSTSGGATSGGATSGGTSAAGTIGHVISNEKGIYALTLPPGRYKVYTSYGGSSTSGAASEVYRIVTLSANVATKTAYPNLYWPDPPAVINNLIDQDLVLSNLAGVAVPVFDPPPCLFYPSTNVSITCATPDATIRYTLDGTEPTATSKVYMGPIAISDDVVITVKAWADGMNPSAAISAAYTFDVSQGAPPGDYFINPIIISGASGTRVVEDNSFYTEESGEPLHTKWLDEAENLYHYYYQYNTIWYEWTAPGSGLMTFTARLVGTHILPPMLAVYTGESLSSIERIVFDADEDKDFYAVASFNVRQGVTYRIVGMSGYEGLYGTFTLTWSGDLVAEPTVTPLEVTTSVLPPATSGVPYAVTLEASGGVAPYVWSSAATALPAGLSLSPGGVLSGTPTTPGVESVTIFVTDDVGTRTGRTFNLTVESEVEPGPDARYSIRFNANGGMGDMDDQVIAVGETQNLNPCLFARVGYVFTGWATSPTGPVLYGDGTGVKDLATSEGGVDLYACWVANRYTVSFDANGGSEVAPITQDYGTAVTAPAAPARTGYTFAGWNPPIPGTMPANDMRMVAQWTANGPVVTFDANGGNVPERSRVVAPGNAVGDLPAANRTDYVLEGWFTAASGGTAVTATTKVSADVTYYAHWRYVGSADEAHIYINVEDSYSSQGNGEFLLELSDLVASYTAPKVAVKGLPTGLKFDAKTLAISGKATKPGIYTVKISVANATVKKAVEKEFLLTVPNLVWDSNSVGVRLEDKYTLQAGIVPNVADSLAAMTAKGWKLAVSGLPSGVKFDAKNLVFTGVAKKEGFYTVYFTATRGKGNTAEKQVATATFEVVFPTLTLTVAAYRDASATNKVKVTGGGKYAFGSKVSLKATPEKGNVFAGWFDAQGNPPAAGSVDYRTASCAYLATDEDVTLMAMFAKESEDVASLKVTVTNATTAADGAYALDLGACVNSLSLPKLTVKGLPAGLKFDSKALKVAGKATKPGVYTVTVEATNTSVKKATDDSKGVFTLTVPNKTCAALPNLKSETDAYDVVLCGVAFNPAWVDCTPVNGWTVKVAGLPAGLKYDAKTGKITGVPTAKPGYYTVTFTATMGREKQEATITLNVAALPAWAVGTFDGATDDGAPVSLTVAANGKISVKTTLADGKSLALAAVSFDTVDGNGGFHAKVIGKSGKETITSEVVAYPSGLAATSPASGEELIPYGVVSGGDWMAYQNLWKRADTKADMPVVKKDIKVDVPGVAGDTDNILTLTFKKDGVVAFAGMVGGMKVSGSSQLVWARRDSAAAGVTANTGGITLYHVTLYAPPKELFTGWSATFGVRLTTDANNVVTSITLTTVYRH